ncbi:MAG: PHP domain-containing protein, partial [Ruthenibacterium sp.]
QSQHQKGWGKMRYDLHLHSCLSPCANDDMTPATIAGMAKLAGAELIAVTDHNSALNLPAAAQACAAYGLRLLPGIEVNTAEEIHVLCYFARVETALAFGQQLYAALPAFPYDPKIWGAQLVMDADDNVTLRVDKLLTGAVTMDIYEVKAACEALGGVAVPAHVDKDSTSVLSVLGFLPDDLPFAAFESRHPEKLPALVERGLLPAGREILTSSDAHCIEDIASCLHTLAETSVLRRLL